MHKVEILALLKQYDVKEVHLALIVNIRILYNPVPYTYKRHNIFLASVPVLDSNQSTQYHEKPIIVMSDRRQSCGVLILNHTGCVSN